jgi:hypothetical protein
VTNAAALESVEIEALVTDRYLDGIFGRLIFLLPDAGNALGLNFVLDGRQDRLFGRIVRQTDTDDVTNQEAVHGDF